MAGAGGHERNRASRRLDHGAVLPAALGEHEQAGKRLICGNRRLE
jgi:hypothetical protein